MKKQNLVTPEDRSKFEFGYRVMQGNQEFVTYRDDMSFRVWYENRADHYGEHHHSSVEVILPLEGECHVNVEGHSYCVTASQVMFVPPGKTHAISMPDNSARNLVLFDATHLTSMRGFTDLMPMMDQVLYLTGEDTLCGDVRKLLFELIREYYERRPLTNLICYDLILQVYVLLGQHWLMHHQPATEGQTRREENTWAVINRVVEYVNDNYTEDITLDSIAKVAGFSKCYFSRMFTRYTGTSFSQYLLRKRIAVAANLLTTTRLSIVQVSLQSGFSSLSTFNRTFKDIHGCTPTEYRAIYEKEYHISM